MIDEASSAEAVSVFFGSVGTPGGNARFGFPVAAVYPANPRVPSGIAGALGAVETEEKGETSPSALEAAETFLDAAAFSSPFSGAFPPSSPSRNVLFSLKAAAEAHCE